jgi:hypothetical protein
MVLGFSTGSEPLVEERLDLLARQRRVVRDGEEGGEPWGRARTTNAITSSP